MQDADRRARKSFAEVGGGCLDVADLAGAGLDLRADHEGRAPAADEASEGLAGGHDAARAGEQPGLRGRAPGRELVEHGHVELAEQREREGAGDRCCGHDQQVRRAALVAHEGSLAHAEAVLLVDDDEAEAAKRDPLGEQCVGADQEIEVAAAGSCQQGAALGLCGRSGQEGHPQAGGGAPRCQAPLVLGGEDLGGGHESRLAAGLDDALDGSEGDEGLAGTDFSLHEAKHRSRSGEVGLDLVDGAPLRGGRFEGNAGTEALASVVFGGQEADGRRRGAIGRPLTQERELDVQEVIEEHAAVRRRTPGQELTQIGRGELPRRRMQEAECGQQRGQAEALEQRLGQGIAEPARLGAGEGGEAEAGDAAVAETFDLWVAHGDRGARGLDVVQLRMDHGHGVARALGLADQADATAGDGALGEATDAVEPSRHEHTRTVWCVLDQFHVGVVTAAEEALLESADRRLDHCKGAVVDLIDAIAAPVITVVDRDPAKEVPAAA